MVYMAGAMLDTQFIGDTILYNKYNDVTGKSTFTPKTIKMLAFLQNRYRRLDKYEDVFDIEYFNTMDKVREEFENRKYYPAFMNADYKCLICYQKLISEKCLERHARWHNVSFVVLRRFRCFLANVIFKQSLAQSVLRTAPDMPPPPPPIFPN